MKRICYDTRMQTINGIKYFDIVQVTKFGTRTVSKVTVESGLNFTQAMKYAESIRDRVNVYQGMKGAVS
jgi:hypothetical protein